MNPAFRRSAIALFFALLTLEVFAAEPWEGPPFSSEPKALLSAAEMIPAGESGVIVLLDEATHTFDASGGSVMTQRLVYRIADESAIDNWGSINAPWAPWYQEKPVLKARVVTKDGTVHELDDKAVIEAPAPEESLDIFSDNRVIRAPLPAVAVGSVVEQLITYKSKESLYDAASSDIFFFGNYYPVHKARFVIEAPADLPLTFLNNARIEQKKEVRDGRQYIVYEGGPFEPKRDYEWELPFDVAPLPWVGVSTAKSWGDLARRYYEIVEKQIANANLDRQLRDALGKSDVKSSDRKEIVAKALAFIQSRVRYAGVEVGESSVVPRPPQTVLSNRYGDCKDKATLLVALLRAAGIEAHVALLRAGEDFDVPRELPGLGMFNHAIVVVGEGENQIWVDPTDEFARAGELPLMDQGRLALIASPKTTSLTQTPLSESTANRVVETRTFTLPEEGKATIVEVTEPTGSDESAMRRYWVSSDRKRYRESMEEYAKNYYGAKALKSMDASDPHDLTKPFRIQLDIADASRGQSMDGEAAVAVFPGNLLTNLPWSLQGGDDEDEDDEATRKRVRRNDFFFTRPFVREWRYKIVPPAGFVARTLPQNETLKIGTMTMTREFAVASDGVVTAVFRVDSGKRRLSAAEVEETKKAIAEHDDMPTVLIGFDQRGTLALTNGNISEALAEFRKLAAQHPKEGRHQVEIAKALLAGGMGEAAREQIRKAIALEPSYARAHRMLGVILQHDLFGRPFRKGFDLEGAIAAYRKAKSLDPKDVGIRAELAKLLEYGEDGILFGRGAKLDEAVIEWRSLIDELKATQYQGELYLALARSARWKELREAAKTAEDSNQRTIWPIVATAATEGAKAAIREAQAVEQSRRREVLRTVGGAVLAMRMYATAADLMEEAMQGSPSAEARQQIEGLRKAKKLEDVPMPKEDPKTIAKQLSIDSTLFEMTPELIKKYYASDEHAFFGDNQKSRWRQQRLGVLSVAQQQGLPLEFYADVGIGSLQFVQDGDDETGYRVRMRSSAARSREETVFVIKENGEYRVSAMHDAPALIGFSVLRLLNANKPEAARTWLNWAREEFTAGSEDPFASSPFAKYWPKNKQSATPEEMRLAAAMLMPSKELGPKALEILLPAREKTATDDERNHIDHALALTYALMEEKSEKLVEVAKRLLKVAPDSSMAFNALCAALTNLDRNAEIIELAKERLARIPKDDDALRAMGMAAMHAGDYAASEKYYRQVVDELRPSSGDYNNIAWNALLSGKDLDRALEDARQAMQSAGGGAALLHTLASLYAETGKSLEAREALLKSMDDAGRDEPAPHDWYVLGRIAENYGATEAALAAYRKVDKPKESVASSTWVLAERRLKAIKK